MTDRIKELAKQAGDDWGHTLQSDKDFLKRFAELVRNSAIDEAVEYVSNQGFGTIASDVMAKRLKS